MQNEPIIAEPRNRIDGTTHTVDWEEIFRRLSVYFMSSFSMHEADASDAAQTVILRLLKSEARRDPAKPLLPWCYRIARNYGIDCHRKRIRAPECKPMAGEEVPGYTGYEPEARFDRAQLKECVARFVDGLSDADREIAFLRYYEDLKFSEIASVTGKATGTIRYRAYVIRKRLQAYLAEVGWND